MHIQRAAISTKSDPLEHQYAGSLFLYSIQQKSTVQMDVQCKHTYMASQQECDR